MNTHTQTLHLWAPLENWSHHWRLVVDRNVAYHSYHLMHNAENPRINLRKGASTKIWTLVGNVPLGPSVLPLDTSPFAFFFFNNCRITYFSEKVHSTTLKYRCCLSLDPNPKTSSSGSMMSLNRSFHPLNGLMGCFSLRGAISPRLRGFGAT
jgi:hypothetical protein